MKKKLVVLSGAGVSAESGLKTFRDSDGLWMGYKIEEVATPRGFKKNPRLVLDFYNMRRREVALAKPNRAHEMIAKLEEVFNVTVITQNIDDLHERAGSSDVMHLHGEIFKMCSSLNKSDVQEIREDIRLGQLSADGSQLRPFIVWFEEAVPMIDEAIAVIEKADLFVLIGTSLQVYPAAGLMNFLQPGIPKFIIDKKIPPLTTADNVITIEKPATEGVVILSSKLRELI